MKLDLHIHTRFSRTKRWGSASLIEPKQLLDKAVELGLDGLAVTDHDEIEGSLLVAELAPHWGLVAIPSIEVSSADGHILALGVCRMVPKGMSAVRTVEMIHELGGIAVAAHPLNILVSLRKSQILGIPIDALETHNARSPRNRKASSLYSSLCVGQTGGSDAHSIDEIGSGITELPVHCADYRHILQVIKQDNALAYGTLANYGDLARACIHTAATQKKDKLKRRILLRLGISAA